MLAFCFVVCDSTQNHICKERSQRSRILLPKQKWRCWVYWYLKVGSLWLEEFKESCDKWNRNMKQHDCHFLITAYSSVTLSFLSLLTKTLLVLWRNRESFQPEERPKEESSSSILQHRLLSWENYVLRWLSLVAELNPCYI